MDGQNYQQTAEESAVIEAEFTHVDEKKPPQA
jgi:hypothetical protein